MSNSLTVLIPALARPQNVEPTLVSLEMSTAAERREGWTITPLFICSSDDQEECDEVRAHGLTPLIHGMKHDDCQYSRKINAGVATTDSDWLFLGADDLDFHYGWLRAAIDVHIATGKLVIGTQDLGNQLVKKGLHATHSLVHRDYVKLGTIDTPGILLHPLYDHNACDVEFCETAMYRDQWAFAEDSIVEHLHPLWHPRTVKRDEVYHKGLKNSARDKLLLRHRRPLWGGPHPTVGEVQRGGARRVMAPRQTARWPKR